MAQLAAKVSIVIPAYNAETTLGACLDGLRAQTDSDCEIIVVDDGSTDATRALAESKNARVISQPNRGAAAARNAGARAARGEIVLFLDADCVPGARWIAAMIAPFADAEIVGAGGMKQTRQTGIIPRFIQMEFDDRYNRVRQHRYIDFIDSGTAAYRRDAFLKHAGFDTSLLDAEDVDLSYRLSEQGRKMKFAPDAIVYCIHPESVFEYLRRKHTYARWRAFVYRRYPRKIAYDSRTPQTQKLQSALAGFLPLALVAAIFWREALWIAGALVLLLLATTLPFVARWSRRARWVALIAPGLIALAAFAVMLGAASGFLSRRRFPKDRAA
jgi:GT2 family glycosyltransferase